MFLRTSRGAINGAHIIRIHKLTDKRAVAVFTQGAQVIEALCDLIEAGRFLGGAVPPSYTEDDEESKFE